MAFNDFLSANSRGDSNRHRRSTSVTPSQKSSTSRVTLVEDDFNLIEDHAETPEKLTKVVTYKYPNYTWRDHLRGLLCLKPSHGKDPIIQESLEPTEVLPRQEMDETFSPWILPVYVLSTRKDTEKHQVPKEAKCTIDTGNMQGNIVSRAFVENVLEFSEANFSELTTAEKEGGTSATGHTLIPDGAIYLTWYHKKSTRVFRNMRFLVSSNQHCDLIIGARSIHKDKLLTVPNLMVEPQGILKFQNGTTYINFEENAGDGKRRPLWKAWRPLYDDRVKLEGKLTKAQKAKHTGLVLQHEQEIKTVEAKLAVPILVLEIYDLAYYPGKDHSKLNKDEQDKLEELFQKLEATEGHKDLKSQLEGITKREAQTETSVV